MKYNSRRRKISWKGIRST